MKTIALFFLSFVSASVLAQKERPDISKITNKNVWEVYNRVAVAETKNGESVLYFNERTADGLAIYQLMEFENGTIELDIKGRNIPGRSFVGVAFHIQDENTFNAIYFRPFNFKNPDKTRSGHSVQYISHPEFTWQKLRNEFPEQFENPVVPVPEPTEWFHAKIVVSWPKVFVFVDDSKEPSLEVIMKSSFRKGKIGLWAGNGSDGSYKNLVVKME